MFNKSIFSHVSTGLPPVDQRAFMAALIASATWALA
jgi:hypothetical protein